MTVTYLDSTIQKVPEDLLAWSEHALWPSVREDYLEWAVAVPYRYREWQENHWHSFGDYNRWLETYNKD